MAKSTTKKTSTKKSGAKYATPRKKAAKKKTAAKKTAAKKSNPTKPAPTPPPQAAGVIDEYQKLTGYMSEMSDTSSDIVSDFVKKQSQYSFDQTGAPSDPMNIAGLMQQVAGSLAKDPSQLVKTQFGLWEDYLKLWESSNKDMVNGAEVEPVATPEPNDKRFRHAAWEENKGLDFIKQSYLIMSKWMRETVAGNTELDDATRSKAVFHTEQFLAAIAPTNFASTNPEVMEEAVKTKGENFIRGYRNLLEDIDRGNGELSIKQVDLEFFKVGVNVATTPGKVVFQNRMLQLIQFSPTTKEVAKRPLLIFPPWINKFYIMDLQPSNSLIKWLVDQGRTVFVVSWVNPDTSMKDTTFEDYITEGCFEAVSAVEQATGEKEVDAVGYCIGGTMLSCALSVMAQKKDTRIKSTTFFTAQTDFVEAGELLLFIDDEQLAAIEQQMDAAGGVLEGAAMSKTFNMLRPNDLIWSVYVENYLKGKDAKRFDLLYWNADATRMAKATHLFYLREFYQKNALAKGKMKMCGVKLDLSKVKIPIYMQAGENDHIAPYRSVFRSAQLWGGPVTYTLAGSGHIAGVINHPDKKKYHYRTNKDLPPTIEKWTEGAARHDYSWWPHWIKWLNKQSRAKVPARKPGSGKLKAIEDAPGSYVMVRSDP